MGKVRRRRDPDDGRPPQPDSPEEPGPRPRWGARYLWLPPLALLVLLAGIDVAVLGRRREPPWVLLAFAAGVAAGGTALMTWRRLRSMRPAPPTPPLAAPMSAGQQAEGVLLVPTALPPPLLPFVGRDPQVDQIERALRLPGAQSRRIVLIRGEAGIGKSALALHVAHRVAADYPDGQLFGRLTAVTPAAVAPSAGTDGPHRPPASVSTVETVLRSFVTALGKPGEELPSSFEGCQHAYARRTAERSVLVVLDDVPLDVDVTPLLPVGARSAVLITSRDGQPAMRPDLVVTLRPLAPQEGVQVLADLLGSDRVATSQQRDAALTIVRSSAALPLALRLAGTSLAARPSWALSLVVELLEEERRAGIVPGGSDSAAFDLSYLLLPEVQRRALRLLGLRESADFAPWMIKALLRDPEIDDRAARRIADRLASVGLVERSSDDGSGEPRFRILDRVWTYATERAQVAAELARTDAQALVAAERQRRHRLDPFLLIRRDVFRLIAAGELTDAIRAARDVLALAKEQDGALELGLALAALAELHSELGNMGEADDFARQAIANGSRDAEVRGLRCRAVRRRRLRQLTAAETDLDAALELVANRDAAERVRLLRDLAWVRALGPDPASGYPLVEEAWTLCRDRLNNGERQLPGVLQSRAVVHWALGNLPAARRDLTEARSVADRNDLLLWRAWIDQALGRTALGERDLPAARLAAKRALDDFEQMRHRYGAAHCRLLIGECLRAGGDSDAAALVLDEALETFGNCGDEWAAARTSSILAQVQSGQGRVDDAVTLARAAERTFADLGDSVQAAEAAGILAVLARRAPAVPAFSTLSAATR